MSPTNSPEVRPEAMIRRRRGRSESAATSRHREETEGAKQSDQKMSALSPSDLVIVGQELVPATDALVSSGKKEQVDRENPRSSLPEAQLTGGLGTGDRAGYQTPEHPGIPKKEGTGSRTGTRKMKALEDRPKIEEEDDGYTPPRGPPISLGPLPPMVPLFTPEQMMRMQTLEQQAPLLRGSGMGGAGFHGPSLTGETPMMAGVGSPATSIHDDGLEMEAGDGADPC